MSETPQVAPPPAPPTQHERDENRARFETEVEVSLYPPVSSRNSTDS